MVNSSSVRMTTTIQHPLVFSCLDIRPTSPAIMTMQSSTFCIDLGALDADDSTGETVKLAAGHALVCRAPAGAKTPDHRPRRYFLCGIFPSQTIRDPTWTSSTNAKVCSNIHQLFTDGPRGGLLDVFV